jgi:anti-sigma factor (TIGR02949 family)
MKPGMHTLMPCHEVVGLLWEYLDGELDDVTHERIREHLGACDHCRDHFTFEGAFIRSVAKVLDAPSDTSDLRTRILAALREAGHGRQP